MAVPIRLHNIPEYIYAPQFSDSHTVSSDSKDTRPQELLQFPKSTCVLWDGTSTGSPIFLHVAQYRKPKLQVLEKVLWLIYKQVGSDGLGSKVLVGTLAVEDDFEGVFFQIERVETRQTDANASLLPDDVLIPVQVSCTGTQDKTGSKEDYAEAVKTLQRRVCGHDALELNNLLLVRGWCSMRSHEHAERTVAHLQFDVVTFSNVFKATPVNPVPIIPVALAKHLVGPRNFSQVQGRPRMGYLSMDATRKLLLVLESDPKVASLPVVGIWVSGVPMVSHPFVWASCLRYLHNERLQDRVCVPPEGFLLLLYTPLHSKPEFYEMSTTSSKPSLEFDLYTGYEVTTLDKKSSGPESSIIEWELSPVRNGPKRELFDAALEEIKSQRQESSGGSTKPPVSVSEDIMPRMTPAPHQSKQTVMIKPMVPEVSMFWSDDNSPAPGVPPFSAAPSGNPSLNTAFSAPPSTPFPASTAPVSSQRVPVGSSVPSSVTGYPAPSSVFPGFSASNCHASSDGQQNGDCMPRARFPVQYPQPQTVYNQNNSARTQISDIAPVPSSEYLGAAYSHSIPQSLSLRHHHPSSQPGNLYSNVPSHSTQGPVPVGMQHSAQPQQQAHTPFAHTNFQAHPQPAPHPHAPVRLMTPAGLQYCPSVQSGPTVRPAASIPHPSQNNQRSQQSSSIPQFLPYQDQRFHGGPVSSSTHPDLHSAQPWPSQPPLHMAQTPTVSQIPQQGQINNIDCFHKSAQGTVVGPHEIPSHSQGPVVSPHEIPSHSQGPSRSSEGQVWPPHRNGEDSGPQSFQLVNGQTRNPASLPCNMHPQQLNLYAHVPVNKVAQTGLSHQPHGHIHSANHTTAIPIAMKQSGSAAQTGNDSHQADSTSCSSTKSSDDSGLSVTPDRSNPSPKPPASPLSKTAEGSSVSLEGVNWEGVPSQVVQLLAQQAAQLQELQAQIQQLLAQQASSPVPSPASNAATPTPASSHPTPPTLKRETCSTAVNTTLLEPMSPHGQLSTRTQCVSIQTSPQLPASSSSQRSEETPQRAFSQDAYPGVEGFVSPFHHNITPTAAVNPQRASAPHTPCRLGRKAHRDTPSDIRHQGPVQLSSTEHEEHSSRPNSIHSSGSLEQPSPIRSMESHFQTSHSSPSPRSASMCAQPDEEEEENAGEGISPDSKEYYDQLINNIRLFLNNHSQDVDNSEANKTDSAPDNQTSACLKLFDSTCAASPAHPAGSSGAGTGSSNNTTLMPHINYLSMMLGSESDTSLEINAMAMKYLRDEQLTQVARHHNSPRARSGSNHQLLRHVLAASFDAASGSDVSRLGISANNLSMATKKYMEKYGLLSGGQGESILDANQTIRLQTDFSLAVMSEPPSGPSLPSSPPKTASPLHPSARSPVKREVLQPAFTPSPAIAEEREYSSGESNRRKVLGDLGASPALRPPQRYSQHPDPSPEDTPIFPERYRRPQGQGLISDCSLATEDDRILDIEKLKQMPKLL